MLKPLTYGCKAFSFKVDFDTSEVELKIPGEKKIVNENCRVKKSARICL